LKPSDQDRVQQAKNRFISANNLKQLALAMHNYLDTYKQFPPVAIFSSQGGKPLLSWRVALLPYLEQNELYKKFRLDEPWDSAHNKKLLAQMPKVYAPVGIKSKEPHTTFYQVFTGKGTMFEGAKGATIGSIPDGLSNTIMIAEAGEPVPWTKPEDLPYDDGKPLPKLGAMFDNGFHIAMADGSVRLVPKKFNERILRLAITCADGKPIDFDDLKP
jgi:hypothetical protein